VISSGCWNSVRQSLRHSANEVVGDVNALGACWRPWRTSSVWRICSLSRRICSWSRRLTSSNRRLSSLDWRLCSVNCCPCASSWHSKPPVSSLSCLFSRLSSLNSRSYCSCSRLSFSSSSYPDFSCAELLLCSSDRGLSCSLLESRSWSVSAVLDVVLKWSF